MNTTDRTIWHALYATLDRIPPQLRPAVVAQRLQAHLHAAINQPLRSWSLVLRASDTRLEDRTCNGATIMDAALVRTMCSPIHIPWPGVTPREAARLLGVSALTVWRWTHPREGGGGRGREGGARRGPRRGPLKRRFQNPLPWKGRVGEGWRHEHSTMAHNFLVHPTLPQPLPQREGSFATVSKRAAPGAGAAPGPGAFVKAKARLAAHELDHPLGPQRHVRCFGKLLVKDVYRNLADRKRDEVRIWTEKPIDPNGLVFVSGDWGEARLRLHERIPADYQQTLCRFWTPGVRWRWRCPGLRAIDDRLLMIDDLKAPSQDQEATPPATSGDHQSSMINHQSPPQRRPCLVTCDKLYWPMPIHTFAAGLEDTLNFWSRQPIGPGFACRNCVGLWYESNEAHWRREIAACRRILDDRFIQRMTHGLLRGADVPDYRHVRISRSD